MAMVSPRVLADVIEANEFPQLSERYQVMGVPKIVINDRVSFTGAQPEPRFLAELQRAVGDGEVERGSDGEMERRSETEVRSET